MLRQRRKTIVPIEIVKDLDVFLKVENDLKDPTTTGGTSKVRFLVESCLIPYIYYPFLVALITALVVLCLTFIRIITFENTSLKYDYSVDWDHESKLKINVDITIATQCMFIGSDVLDVTNKNPLEAGKLDEEDTWFELSNTQARAFKNLQIGNELLRKQYHAIHDVIWLDGFNMHNEQLPKREINPDRPKDACRFHGTLEVTKVAGNFHIIMGKSFSLFGAHAHLSPLGIEYAMNFSHRIDQFSFGHPSPGLVQPLNGDLKLSKTATQMYQYFIEVVPTVVDTRHANVETYQYAVTEKTREINHNQGSHGIPGIFIRYEISPMKITVKEVNRSYWFLLVEIGGIIGGVFATSGMIHSIINILYESFYKKGEKSHHEMNETIIIAKNNVGVTPESSAVLQ
ncbi:unnamed protein product [Didymodactylos carnosus]|uniref:Endoplasmic reticulum-Golgi intermediate compartment protein 2 n=1 Tax=Didymodactylos carnosus TaxID=1234261 RepID=A0A814AT08_9BILA|nr:unnamed protein product [Didymodactylos carnosus]CAF0975432.1 unnamed protein product [Didymodactylos carnosus]CAF3697828.1 unnamed protein product [Didymodactylos carnosus]CAF3746224.1 unnamed protein product [Didymodactylos carnosus]